MTTNNYADLPAEVQNHLRAIKDFIDGQKTVAPTGTDIAADRVMGVEDATASLDDLVDAIRALTSRGESPVSTKRE